MIGRVISHYQVLDKLGEGGMGVVYKARDTHLDRFVAIKVLPAEKVSDPERKHRFVQEAKAASALNHPNIVTIYDIDATDDVHFIAMEYVRGKTLGSVVGRKGLKTVEALKYAVQAADALSCAHQAGIIHRDLKPANIMVTEQGLVKILDFGLAKLTEPAAPDELGATRTLEDQEAGTEKGTILGTVAYMSPEQAEAKKLDARSDMFSFGAVLYEMLCGRRAFQGETGISTLAAILHKEPRPLGEVSEGVPHELERIVSRCLRKDPARRFQTMSDLKLALEDLKEDFDSGALVPLAVVRLPRRRALAWVAGLALLAAGVLAGWLVFARRGVSPTALTAIPLTTYPGSERNPTFSPDGNQVAFAWDGEKQDNFDIYVKLIGAGSPLRLTTDPAYDFSPAWSPDGRSIAFLRRLLGVRAAVMLISPLGGTERILAETRDVTPAMWDSSGSLSWSPDGRYLAVLDKLSAGEPVALFLLSVETGEKRRLTQPPPKIVGDSGPAFSPDGRMLAFTRSTGTSANDLYVISLSSALSPEGEPKRLTFDNRTTYGLAWTPDGREIVFSSNRAGVYSLWRIPAKGGAPRRLESIGEDGFFPAISRQGHRLVYTRSWSDINIWRVELPDTRAGSVPGPLNSSLFIASSRIDASARISPDGKRVVFASDRSGFFEIWMSDSSGLNPVQLTSIAAYSASPSWSPDGGRIAFDSNVVGHFEVYVLNANGGRPKRLTNGSAESAMPSWSWDGKWIYFRSVRSGENQVWKMPSAGGDPIQVTRNGGFYAVEHEDGAFLYYTKTDQVSGLWRAPVAGGQETRIVEAVKARSFAVVKDGIYFFAPGPSEKTLLQFYKFARTQMVTLGTIEKPVFLYLDVSRDGRWLLYSQRDQRVEDLMLVENFR